MWIDWLFGRVIGPCNFLAVGTPPILMSGNTQWMLPTKLRRGIWGRPEIMWTIWMV